MEVYQIDHEGYFLYAVQARPDPLTPGAYLIPGGCITTAPPASTDTHWPRWVNNAWTLVPLAPQIPLDQLTPEQELTLWRDGATLSFAQTLIGLKEEAWMSEADCLAWSLGTLPAVILAAISSLDESLQYEATVRARIPSVISRNYMLVNFLGTLNSKTPEEIDTFFVTYKQR
jgi:hypothetical protein